MVTTAEQSRRTNTRLYTDVFIKRKKDDGSYESEWFDITRFVILGGIGDIKISLDSQDYDIGVFVQDSLTISFDNREGRFNDLEDSRSFWASYPSVHLTKFRIDYGYLDDDGVKIPDQSFIGFLDERSLRISDNDSVTGTILSLNFILNSVSVPSGLLGSSEPASDVIRKILTRGEILDHINVDSTNIIPSNDITIDDPSVYENLKVNAALNKVLLLTNSVAYIDNSQNFIVKSRNVSQQVVHRFFHNPRKKRTGPDNLYGIRGFNSGRQRVKNAFFWSGSTEFSKSEPHHLDRYGVAKKNIAAAEITNTVTRQSILDDLRDEFQFPKQEFIAETDYLGSDAQLLQTCTFDVQPSYVNPSEVYQIGSSQIGASKIAKFGSGVFIRVEKGYKILSITHSLSRARTTLKVREIGKTLTDGFLTMATGNVYDVSFSAETTKTINVAADSINAQQAKVEILNADDNYKTTEFTITRPNTSEVVITASSAITINLRVLVLEVTQQ